MKKMFLMFLLCGAILLNASAQEKVYQIDEVSVINYGDGRLLFRQQNEEKAPLQGEHRIIDGYHSEYLIANFKDGMFDGLYRHYKNNMLIEESTYKNGNLDGYRKAFYPDGKTLAQESTFIDGKMNGIIKSYYQNGQVETEVSYKMGVQDGPDRRYSEDGKLLLDTYYKDGLPDGNWVEHITSNKGDYTCRRSFKNGKMTGEYSRIWASGKPREKGTYKDGKKEGVWTEYRDDGTPSVSTTYKADEKTGEEKHYFTNGKVETSRNFLNGKRDGISREYYSNGKLKLERTYKANKEEGPYKRFYEDGTLREEGRCENDTEVYRKEYYDNGKLKAVAERPNGSGSWTTLERYDRNGNKQ